jgi:hypothetical protein
MYGFNKPKDNQKGGTPARCLKSLIEHGWRGFRGFTQVKEK